MNTPKPIRRRPSHARGFTLVELMLVTVIVAVLATVALPAYRSHVLRTHRAVAVQTLAQLATQQQSYYTDRKRYGATLQELGHVAEVLHLHADGALRAANAGAIYRLHIDEDASALSYALIATPINRQLADRCGTLSLDQDGRRRASGGDALACWK